MATLNDLTRLAFRRRDRIAVQNYIDATYPGCGLTVETHEATSPYFIWLGNVSIGIGHSADETLCKPVDDEDEDFEPDDDETGIFFYEVDGGRRADEEKFFHLKSAVDEAVRRATTK